MDALKAAILQAEEDSHMRHTPLRQAFNALNNLQLQGGGGQMGGEYPQAYDLTRASTILLVSEANPKAQDFRVRVWKGFWKTLNSDQQNDLKELDESQVYQFIHTHNLIGGRGLPWGWYRIIQGPREDEFSTLPQEGGKMRYINETGIYNVKQLPPAFFKSNHIQTELFKVDPLNPSVTHEDLQNEGFMRVMFTDEADTTTYIVYFEKDTKQYYRNLPEETLKRLSQAA